MIILKFYFMKMPSLIILLFLSTSLVAQNSPSNEFKDSIVTTQRPLYSLNYPASWSMDTSKTLGVDLLLRSQKSEPLDSFIENMTVFVLNLSGHGYNLSKMGSESEMQTRNMITDVEILESRLDSSS